MRKWSPAFERKVGANLPRGTELIFQMQRLCWKWRLNTGADGGQSRTDEGRQQHSTDLCTARPLPTSIRHQSQHKLTLAPHLHIHYKWIPRKPFHFTETALSEARFFFWTACQIQGVIWFLWLIENNFHDSQTPEYYSDWMSLFFFLFFLLSCNCDWFCVR